MKQLLRAVALLTFCSAVSACGGEKVRFKPIPIPAERMDCTTIAKADRPSLAPVYVIDWATVLTVPAAKIEVDRLMMSVLNRESIVVNYVLDLEGRVFVCSSDAEWLRDYSNKVDK